MKWFSNPLQLLTILALVTLAKPALAAPPVEVTPEPSSIIVFGGLAVIGIFGWLWQGRRRRG